MSRNRFRVEYKCDCGCDYGSCGRNNVLLYEYNCSCDIGRIVMVNHIGSDSESVINFGYLSDNDLDAIKTLVASEIKHTPFTEEQNEIFNRTK